jgi:uncharacterized protein
MPKNFLKSVVPSASRIRAIKGLGVLGEWIYAPNLWHINRYSASMAFLVGLFVAFVPAPGQTLLAAALAVLLRCNLPLAVGLVFLTNPITMPPLFYMAYQIGALIVDVPVQNMEFDLSFTWLGANLAAIGKPFLLGCLICGLFFGSLGYLTINLLWRWRVVRHLKARRRRSAASGISGPG